MNWKLKMRLPVWILCALVAGFFMPAFLSAQEANCSEIAAVARMARARSVAALEAANKRSGESYRARLVYSYRAFQFHGTRSKAEALLTLIPTDEGQQTIVMTLGDSLCDGEPLKDMEALSHVNESFARELARAVILAPKFLPAYVAYSLVAVSDPHSDFAVRMSKVCQQDRSGFLNALKQLPDDKRRLFAQHVMDADHCKALALPEASWKRDEGDTVDVKTGNLRMMIPLVATAKPSH